MAAGIPFCDLKIPFILLLCFIYSHTQPGYWIRENVYGVDRRSQRLMIWSATDLIKSTYQLVDSIEYIRQNNLNTPNYEIGYLMFTIFEKYEKMLNKYNTSLTMRRALWIAELVIYLEEVENHHWEIEHLSAQGFTDLQKVFNDSIYQELSWSVKVLLLKNYFNDTTTPEPEILKVTESPEEDRVPPIEALVLRRQEDYGEAGAEKEKEDENNMRLQLFRLMYETIRDSDMKCKRAELIKSHYEDSSTLEIGYLMGDVMDKYNIMNDISMTLSRLYNEWKPIEHLNAYEQISSQAIEINHLIDMIIGIDKKQKETKKDSTL